LNTVFKYIQNRRILHSLLIRKMSTSEDFIGNFSVIESTSFRKKIYEACLLMSMEHYEILKKNYEQDRFPADKYYNLATKNSNEKEVKIRTGPPKKKRNPVKKNYTDANDADANDADANDADTNDADTNDADTNDADTNDADTNDADTNDADADDAKDATEKKKNKTYPIIFNKDAKVMLDFICSRFLWEIYSIDTEDEWPESKEDVVTFALNNAHTNFPKGNITKLIITSVASMQPSKIIPKSYGIDKEIRSKFDAYLDNVSVSDMVSTYLTGFLKLLCLYFTNRFWSEKTQTVNMKIFETVLRYIELSIPVNSNTVSFGLVAEMNQYKELVNTPPDKKSDDKNADVSTKANSKAKTMSKKESKAMSKKEAKAMPKKEAKAMPKKEAKAMPKKEAKAMPKKEAKAMPKKEAKAMSKAKPESEDEEDEEDADEEDGYSDS
jgi:hypothetical protein